MKRLVCVLVALSKLCLLVQKILQQRNEQREHQKKERLDIAICTLLLVPLSSAGLSVQYPSGLFSFLW